MAEFIWSLTETTPIPVECRRMASGNTAPPLITNYQSQAMEMKENNTNPIKQKSSDFLI